MIDTGNSAGSSIMSNLGSIIRSSFGNSIECCNGSSIWDDMKKTNFSGLV